MFKGLFAGLLSGLIAAFMPACDGINLKRLKPGVTTVQEVREIMGEPTMEWADADGSQTWEYPRTPNGVVNYMIDFGPDQRLRNVRQVLTEENFALVQRGMTREQIRRLLGQPASEAYFTLKKEYAWEWKIRSEGADNVFFDVYFDESGGVTRTGSHSVPGH